MFKSLNFRKFLKKKVVAQLFINQGGIFSRYTLLNFPSLFSPGTSYPVTATVRIYSNDKSPVLEQKYILQPFESKEVFFGYENDLPGMGVFTVEIEPLSIFSTNDSHLGRLTPHFYSFFHTKDFTSLGMIHPQGLLNKKNKRVDWKSKVMIDSSVVKKLTVFQMNAINLTQTNRISLKTEADEFIEVRETEFLPYSSSFQGFDLPENEKLYIEMDKLNSGNAKPLLFLYLEDGTFTVVHS